MYTSVNEGWAQPHNMMGDVEAAVGVLEEQWLFWVLMRAVLANFFSPGSPYWWEDTETSFAPMPVSQSIFWALDEG